MEIFDYVMNPEFVRKLNRDIFSSGDLTLFFAFFFDFWADSVIKLRQNTTHRFYIPRGVLGTRVNGVGSSDTWSDAGRIRVDGQIRF